MKEIDDDHLHPGSIIRPGWITKHIIAARNETGVLDLRIISKARVPFISASPVGDDLGRILTSIERPPRLPMKTAYSGSWFPPQNSHQQVLLSSDSTRRFTIRTSTIGLVCFVQIMSKSGFPPKSLHL